MAASARKSPRPSVLEGKPSSANKYALRRAVSGLLNSKVSNL